MRVLLLADINSSHTRKWAVSLAEKGFAMGIFSLGKPETDWWEDKNITVFNADIEKKKYSSSSFSKISYLKTLPKAKQVIEEFKPDILHAHYATSYGLIGARTHFHPYIISCWGSDVMEFPKKSFMHQFVVKNILSKANRILATSDTIKRSIQEILEKEVIIIPFGVDMEVFSPVKVKSIFDEGTIVIGTIKSLEKNYCIDILIKAFAQIQEEFPICRLLIVGEGTQRKNLEALVGKFGLKKEIIFTGKIEYAQIPYYHNMIDIFVNISERESFGVSVIEAMACAKTVIVTETGGLSDIVVDNTIGLKIPVNDINSLVSKLKFLLNDKAIRERMGKDARKYVEEKFDWKRNIEQMSAIYNEMKT